MFFFHKSIFTLENREMNIIEWININTKIPVSNRNISNGLVIESVLRHFFMINSEVIGEDTEYDCCYFKKWDQLKISVLLFDFCLELFCMWMVN